MKKNNILVLIPIIILFILSIIFLPDYLRIKQIIWIVIGLVLFFIINKININKITKYSFIFYIISILLLLTVLVLNNFTNGSRGWLNLGFISIQPSELTKISLILLTIKYYDKLNIFKLIIIYLIPIVLIFIEPDTGAVIIDLIILMYFIIKKLNIKKIILLMCILVIGIFLIIYLFIYNKDLIVSILGPNIFYRIDRITNFFNDNNIQTTNALVSIATGNTLYFPEMFNDFFIAYILSKNIFMIFIIIISTIILLFILKRKNTLVSQAVFYSYLFQFWWNISMNLKIVPVIGIPYLFLSYGGSHIICNMILIALINKISDNNKDNYNMDILD